MTVSHPVWAVYEQHEHHQRRRDRLARLCFETGIGRAALYKYFSGVKPILIAWHERHVAEQLEQHFVSIMRGLIDEAVNSGPAHADVPVDQLTTFCLHSLEGARAEGWTVRLWNG